MTCPAITLEGLYQRRAGSDAFQWTRRLGPSVAQPGYRLSQLTWKGGRGPDGVGLISPVHVWSSQRGVFSPELNILCELWPSICSSLGGVAVGRAVPGGACAKGAALPGSLRESTHTLLPLAAPS